MLTIPDGYENLTRTGTATFTYDTIANIGTIFGLPGNTSDTSYTFRTYFSGTNTVDGFDYLLPATWFSELTTYQNLASYLHQP